MKSQVIIWDLKNKRDLTEAELYSIIDNDEYEDLDQKENIFFIMKVLYHQVSTQAG
jgi:hypothetical protein